VEAGGFDDYKIIYSGKGTIVAARGKINIDMVQEIDAVYENGVLRPLTPVKLAESETVHVRISTEAEDPTVDVALIERCRAELAGKVVPSLEEVLRATASIPGNWSDDIIAERGEY
jgi:predicted DNA-binding antitoxin AbrB/MazE fold protein